ncbi:ABC transporter [Paramagnetospirillum marisnigri]|uniref:ABC transporter n=1 Tax=Paramagnetospirillum marisnigri TaxID=1285242 RepID=A0A178M7E6_9PROT|nr:ABC transporter ATP-binding protein/permease [Paramagnetospirillum marisnigri]OAN44680.1 ABC transporter [Paramagnetospirillum marisnigri]
MASDATTQTTPRTGEPEPLRQPSFLRRFAALAGPYWNSNEKWTVRGLAALLLLLTVCQVVIPILINLWSASLFDALEQKSLERFFTQIIQIGFILLASMTVTATHLKVKRRIQLGWRRWLTRRLQDNWMATGHHYQLLHMPGDHDNPDGRIAEDIRNTTEAALDLAHSLVYCGLLLGSFIQILWTLSGELSITIADVEIPIPGHMVWVALIYASAASSLALLVGRPLVRATDKRQTAEANFRFGLVRARENSEAIALLHGEVGERRRFSELFRGIEGAWNRQTRGLTRLFIFTSGYSVFSTAFPILIAAPRYIAGITTLGQLMQTAQAFQQLSQALSWPVDNMQRVAEWRASVERVLALHEALAALKEDTSRPDAHTIVVQKSTMPTLCFHDLTIANADGAVVLQGFSAEIDPGEHVLVGGDPGAAVKLFKVVAGLWPWGKGTVGLPCDATLFFMPQRPYMPIGTLRGVLAYPSATECFADEALGAALEQVGLGHLTERLGQSDAWEQILTAGEQQRLGFARLLLHRPKWVFLQEATDAMDPEGERRMMQLLLDEFPAATVITVGFHADLEPYHQRKLTLTPTPEGLILVRESRKAWEQPKRSVNWGGRLFSSLLRRNERRALISGMWKRGDWRN